MKGRVLAIAILLLFGTCAKLCISQSNQASVDSQLESLRADLRADHVALVTEAMQLSEQESKLFWPVYRKYETEMAAVNDKRLTMIKSYNEKYEKLSNGDARAIIEQGLDLAAQRLDVKKKYANEFLGAGLSALTVARFLQLENRLDLIVDLVIAAELPAVLTKPVTQTVPK